MNSKFSWNLSYIDFRSFVGESFDRWIYKLL